MQNSSVAAIEQAVPSPTATQLTLSKAFSKNMVLQREENCRIWGFSTDPDGAVVTAEINGVKGSGVVEDGRWEVMLPPMEANTTPGNLIVRGAGDCCQVVTNVLIGDVWFTNGQSNMDYNMEIVKNWETENPRLNLAIIFVIFIKTSMRCIATQSAEIANIRNISRTSVRMSLR